MKNIPLEPEPERICADATGCEFGQGGDCPFAARQVRSREEENESACPLTDQPVSWVQP
jgi:hypothetical protein